MSNIEKIEKAINVAYRMEFMKSKDVIATVRTLIQAIKTMRESMENDYKRQISDKGQELSSMVQRLEKELVKAEKRIEEVGEMGNVSIAELKVYLIEESNKVREYARELIESAPQFDPTGLQQMIEEVARKTDGIRNDTPEELRDKLESLSDEEKLDLNAIRGLKEELEQIRLTKGKGAIGGTRLLKNMSDVDIRTTQPNNNATIQYSSDGQNFVTGVAITVSATEPTDPKTNDLWVDIS